MARQQNNNSPAPLSPRQEGLFDLVASQATAYPRQAFVYVCNAVQVIANEIAADHAKKSNSSRTRHISGQELAHGLKNLLMKDFGRMAIDVLNEWNIHTTMDFGNIVYDLVAVRLLSVSPHDSPDDFADLYDFKEVFEPERSKKPAPLPVIDFLNK